MGKILDELWHGNINPCMQREMSGEMKKLLSHIVKHREALEETLNKEQRELLEKFDDNHGEFSSISEREIFTHAFCLGARIAIEVMSFEI